MRKTFHENIERLNGNWVAYDSIGNSWRVVKRRYYWEAFANIPCEDKLLKVHYLCANTLNDLACFIYAEGGKAK